MAGSNTKAATFKNGWSAGVGWGLGLIFVAIVVLVIYVGFSSPLHHLCDRYAAASQPGAAQQTTRGEPVISAAQIRNDIIAYYNTFIMILVALLGASAIIGYLHLRHISKQDAEHRAYEAVEHYFALEKTSRLLDTRIGERVEEWITDPDALTGRLDRLEGQVEDIRQFSDLPATVDPEPK